MLDGATYARTVGSLSRGEGHCSSFPSLDNQQQKTNNLLTHSHPPQQTLGKGQTDVWDGLPTAEDY